MENQLLDKGPVNFAEKALSEGQCASSIAPIPVFPYVPGCKSSVLAVFGWARHIQQHVNAAAELKLMCMYSARPVSACPHYHGKQVLMAAG
eukprot:1161322-Pelagomonas_calceolata.AAC.1